LPDGHLEFAAECLLIKPVTVSLTRSSRSSVSKATDCIQL
jgi:hypothetical protein